MRVISEKAAQSAVDIAVAATPGPRRGLVAPYPDVEHVSSPDVPGAWRAGRKIAFIFLAGAAIWAGVAWLIRQAM